MNVVDKPSLDAVYLAHFGVKGMKWGRRRATDKPTIKQRAQKLGLAATTVAGAALVAQIMGANGRARMGEMALNNYVRAKQAKAQAGTNPFSEFSRHYQFARAGELKAQAKREAKAQAKENA